MRQWRGRSSTILDYKVELYEKALRSAELDLSHYKLLPKIVGNAGYHRRNNYNASGSFNLITNTPNFGASTSREKAHSRS